MNSTINGGSNTGGLVGYLHYGQVNYCFTDATVNGETNTGGLVGKIEGGLNDEQTARLDDCLYLGNHVSGTANTSHGVFGTSSGSVEVKAFYTNPNMEGKTSGDVYAVKVALDPSVSNNDISLEFIYEKTIGYGGYWYCIADGTSTFTISGKDDHQKVTLVSVNDEEIGTAAGTYTIPVRDGVSDYVISASVNLQLLDNAANTTVVNQCNNSTYDVILKNRTLYKDGNWNTICLPFNFEIEGSILDEPGVTLMELDTEAGNYDHPTGFDSGTLYLNFKSAGTTIEAGKPYIIKWTKPSGYDSNPDEFDISDPVFGGVTINSAEPTTITSADETVSFVGCYSPFTLYANDRTNLYLGSDNTLYYPSTNVTINSCRAYFQLNGISAAGISSEVNAFVLNFGDDDKASGIVDIDHLPLLTIDHSDGAWYSIDGRKLSGKPTAKGIYIKDGKKMVVK